MKLDGDDVIVLQDDGTQEVYRGVTLAQAQKLLRLKREARNRCLRVRVQGKRTNEVVADLYDEAWREYRAYADEVRSSNPDAVI